MRTYFAVVKFNFYKILAYPKNLMSKLISDITLKYKVIDIDMLSVPLEDIIEDLFKRE